MRQPILSPSAFLLLALSSTLPAFAQKTWDGGAGTGNWGDAANWQSDGVPGTVALTFDAALANGQFNVSLGTDRAASGLVFAAANGTNAFTLLGQALTVGAGGIVNQDTELQRFHSTVATGAAQTWDSGAGGLRFQNVTLNHALALLGTGGVSLDGSLIVTGARTLTATTAAPLLIHTLELGGNLTLNGSAATTVSGTTTLDHHRTVTNDAGRLTLTDVAMPTARTLTIAGSGETEVAGTITSGSLAKQGAGTLTLSTANTYTGATTVNGGTLLVTHNGALGSTVNGTTVGTNSTLALSGGVVITGETLSLNGHGANGEGALRNVDGYNIWAGSVTLAGSATITSADGTLQIGVNPGPGLPQPQSIALGADTLTVNTDGGDVRIEANLFGAGGNLVKTGAGTLSLGGLSNNHTGTTTITDGTLRLFTVNEPAVGAQNVGLVSSIVIGDNVGAAGSASLVYGLPGASTISGNRIRDTSTVRVNRDGLFDTSGANEIVGAITFEGGEITTRGGMLGITADITALASEREAAISGAGTLNLGDVTRTINTADGASLRIESGITDGGLIKDGGGHLALSGASTYRGETEIRAGTVTIRSDSALGSTFGGTTVRDGAALQVENSLSSAENLAVYGSGRSNTGAIRNLSGDNTLSGAITLGSATRINSDAGRLNLAGPITGAGQSLTVGGAGHTRITGVIGTGTGTVTKDGSGTLTLAAQNTYTGLTTVQGGVLSFATTHVIGSSNVIHTATGTVVDLNGFNQSIGMVTGTGSIVFDGAELILNGSGTFGGSFEGAGTLILAAGSSLTLGADFNNTGLNIVLAGGSLYLNGHSSTFGSLLVTANSLLDFGEGGGSILQFTQGVLANSTLQVSNWVDTIDYFYSTVNAGVQGTAPLNNIVFDGFTGDDTRWLPYTDGPYNDHQITPVPEPRVYGAGLMAVLVGVLGWYRRRQKAGARAAVVSA